MVDAYTIIQCIPLPNYELGLSFNDGMLGSVDMTRVVDETILKIWKNDYKKFEAAVAGPTLQTVCWPDTIMADGKTLEIDSIKLLNNMRQECL